jgi:small conductance mechanosensitive channel
VPFVRSAVSSGFLNADNGECRKNDGTLCGYVLDWTGERWLAESSDWLIAKPLSILLIIVVAVLVRLLLNRVINRVAKRAAEGSVPGFMARNRGHAVLESSPLLSARRSQRAATMGSVLRSITTGVVASIALIMIIAELGINIAPLIASAGIVGVALGFGAQSLVKDFLSGIFMILEDQYGVGDVIDGGDATGVVEGVGLRVTRLRDISGTVWYLRNGEIPRVGNMSQGWARAVLDIGVAYHEDIGAVRDLIYDTAQELYDDPDYRDLVLDGPEVWGVEALGNDAVVVRLVAKTKPLQQWAVGRALRERVKAAFDTHGVEFPFPQRAVWLRSEGPGSEPGDDGEEADAAPGSDAVTRQPRERPAPPTRPRQGGVRSEYTGEFPAVQDEETGAEVAPGQAAAEQSDAERAERDQAAEDDRTG